MYWFLQRKNKVSAYLIVVALIFCLITPTSAWADLAQQQDMLQALETLADATLDQEQCVEDVTSSEPDAKQNIESAVDSPEQQHDLAENQLNQAIAAEDDPQQNIISDVAADQNQAATPNEPGKGSGNLTPPPSAHEKYVTVSVEKRSLNEPDIYPPTQVTLEDGDTAFTIIQRLLGVSVEYRGSGAALYVEAIDGLGEFDRGPGSGWMYAVNDWFPNYSAGIYELKDGDVLRWQYTTNLGEDIGGDGAINPATEEQIAQLNDLVKTAQDLDPDLYTKTSWQLLLQKLALAEQLLQLNPPGKNKLQKSMASLQEALDQLEPAPEPEPVVERQQLITKINETKQLDQNLYTETSWQKLTQAVTEAEILLDSENATPEQISQAYATLIAALENLAKKGGGGGSGGTPPPADTKKALVSVEKLSLGEGYILAPTEVTLEDGDTAFTIIKRLLGSKVEYRGSGTSLYVEAIDGLGEFDRGAGSGWMYSVNDWFPNYSAGIYNLQDKDVLRWQYTTNLGKDIGGEYALGGGADLLALKEKVFEAEKLKASDYSKEEWKILTDKLRAAKEVLKKAGVTQAEVDQALLELTQAIDKTTGTAGAAAGVKKESDPNIVQAIKASVQWMLKQKQLSDGQALGIARAGEHVPDDYLKELTHKLQAGQGDLEKVVDYAGMVLAVTALGQDAHDFAGYNLIEKIFNHPQATAQGINGVVLALIALDCGGYTVPDNALWGRQQLIDWLLMRQQSDGSFPAKTSNTTGDVDTTAMVLQALANYQNQANVKKAIEKAIDFLSRKQLEDGGYNNSTDVSQTIIALTALGIDPAEDSRFKKAKGNLINKLTSFIQSDGSFAHVQGKGSNDLATEQGLMALVAYDRFLQGLPKLYDITKQAQSQETPKPQPTPTQEQTNTGLPLLDVQQVSRWAQKGVQKAWDYGLLEAQQWGRSSTTTPQAYISRAEFMAGLSQIDGLKAVEDITIGGGTDQDIITREQAAVLLTQALNLNNVDTAAGFKDLNQASNWAQDAIEKVYHEQIMVGADGLFMPEDAMTMEMAAVLLGRLYER